MCASISSRVTWSKNALYWAGEEAKRLGRMTSNSEGLRPLYELLCTERGQLGLPAHEHKAHRHGVHRYAGVIG